MRQHRFHDVTSTMTRLPARRDLLRGLAGAGLGLGVARLPELVGARNSRKKRKKVKKPQPNAFGCLEVGDACGIEVDCCSGLCEGKKGKRRCMAHDTGGCVAGSAPVGCGGTEDIACSIGPGEVGACATTTGNAGYCAGAFVDYQCQTDLDCQMMDDVPGTRSACIRCTDGVGGSICARVAGTPS